MLLTKKNIVSYGISFSEFIIKKFLSRYFDEKLEVQ